MPQCAILLFDGFDELDALAPYEVLRRAEEAGAPFAVSLVSREGAREVTAFYGARIQAEAALTLEARPDILIVPGGGWNHRGKHGVRVEVERGEAPRLIAQLHAAGTIVAGVCTGAMLLAAAGLTKERPATTHQPGPRGATRDGRRGLRRACGGRRRCDYFGGRHVGAGPRALVGRALRRFCAGARSRAAAGVRAARRCLAQNDIAEQM